METQAKYHIKTSLFYGFFANSIKATGYDDFASGNHDMTSLQAVRDVNFPFKFDMVTNSIRNKIASRGVLNNARGVGFDSAASEEQSGMRVRLLIRSSVIIKQQWSLIAIKWS